MNIIKVYDHPVVDFAAEELKKYLRMMMPYAGEISIVREAEEGFRLGLLSDFGLSASDVEDPVHDDVVYLDTEEKGGIIAGSNPRSVLLSVYRYLKLQGCRFLFPGVDGEKIPVRNVTPLKYRKKADNRYRGECNEGAEFQQCVLDAIDYAPKIGLNVFMIEFDVPKNYYDKYYNHSYNPEREAEPVSPGQVLQWKRACEAEIAKRGLLFHDMGHGWTAESFGISSVKGWVKEDHPEIPQEAKQYLAEIGGKRDLFRGIALNTNFCMSNPEARRRVVRHVVDYAKKCRHADCIHVWLADGLKNHCECPECVKMRPSDWYATLLNEIDDELIRENLPTKIGGLCYMDLAWQPEKVKLKHPDRYLFILGASRSYLYSVGKDPVVPETPYVHNENARLSTTEEYVMRAHLWMEMGAQAFIAYEYHFWVADKYAPGLLSMAKRLYEDVRSYKLNRFSGMIEDGSQRAFFPNGLCFYVYAETLFDMELSFETVVCEYLEAAYGEAFSCVKAFLEKIDALLPQSYLEFARCKTHTPDDYHDASMLPKFQEAKEVIASFREEIAAFRSPASRAELVATRLLSDYYLDYLTFLTDAFTAKAKGDDDEAYRLYQKFLSDFGKREAAIERYYDQHMFGYALSAPMKLGTTPAK